MRSTECTSSYYYYYPTNARPMLFVGYRVWRKFFVQKRFPIGVNFCTMVDMSRTGFLLSCSSYALATCFQSYSNSIQTRSSVERIYLWQRCFDALKPRIAASTGVQYQYVGFSWRNKIPRCSAYAMGESNPVPASRLWSGSGSKVNQFVHVPTSVDTQHFIQIHARVFE